MRLLIPAATVIALSVTAAAAHAATGWIVRAGAAATGRTVSATLDGTGSAPQVHMTDTTNGSVLSCTATSARASTVVGARSSGTGLVRLAGAAFELDNCRGILGLQLSPASAGTWSFDATSYNGQTGTTTGVLDGVRLELTGSGARSHSAARYR